MRPEGLIVLCILLMVTFIIATPFRLSLCLALEFFLRKKFQKDTQEFAQLIPKQAFQEILLKSCLLKILKRIGAFKPPQILNYNFALAY